MLAEKAKILRIRTGQSTLEFCFALVLLVLLVYGLVQAVRWVVMETVERRYDYDRTMTVNGGKTHFHVLRTLDMEFH